MKENHTFHKRKDGRWQVTLFLNGKRKDIYGKTKAELKRKLEEISQEEDKKQQTLESYLQEYLVHNKLHVVKPSTYDRYESTLLSHIKGSSIGRAKMADLTKEQCKLYFLDLTKQDLSLSSVKKVKELLKQGLYEAVDDKIIPENPMERLKVPTKNLEQKQARKSLLEEEEFIFTEEEKEKLRKISKKLWSDRKTKKNSLAILFCILTGLRMGEMLALTWKCIKCGKEEMFVYETVTREKVRDDQGEYTGKIKQTTDSVKTLRSNRKVWLCPEAIEILHEMEARNKELQIQSEYVFCSARGTQVSPRNMERMYKDILEMADIRARRFHSTRSTFTTDNINAGVPLVTVQKWLGHARPSITLDSYTKYSQEAEQEAINAIKKRRKMS